jgi:serine/threonine protein kinase
LTKSDLTDFKKCSALPKDGIMSTNINKSLDKLLLINIPDGGEALDNFIYRHSAYEEIIEINKSMIQLYVNGIIPMNKLNIYHSDIKDSNVLISRKKDHSLQAKLIDWGLAVIYNPKKDEDLPENWKNRPLQFNVPFSIIIFSNKFEEKYSNFLNKSNGKITRAKLMPFVLNYITEWNEIRGLGHFKYITHIFFMFFEKNHPQEKNNNIFFEKTYTLPYITNYIVKILLAFNPKEYLNTIFVKNVDVWGLMMTYYPIMEIIYDNYKTSTKNDIKIFNFIKSLYLNVLYKNGDKVITVSKVLKEMNKFTTLFKNPITKTMRKNKNITLSNKSWKSTKSTKHNTSRKLKYLDV